MLSLIDRLYSDNTGEKLKAQIVKNDSLKRYRTLYFENLVDFRLCPKNANTTMKHVYCQLMFNNDMDFSTNQRSVENFKNIKYIQQDDPFLFRKSSYKICIKRDPIERALSAAKYILKHRLNIVHPTLDEINELLNNISIDLDFHFNSQTFWMGSSDMYDAVYDISELDSLVDWLINDYRYYDIVNKKKNISESNIKTEDLPINILKKIKKFYEIDYDNGWY